MTIQFGLGPEQLSSELRNAWNFDFTLVYTVALSATTLQTSLRVENTDKKPWDFQVLFHTYFKIPDVGSILVNGLSGVNVKDKILKTEYAEASQEVAIKSEVDRVYEMVAEKVAISADGKVLFDVERSNLGDVGM